MADRRCLLPLKTDTSWRIQALTPAGASQRRVCVFWAIMCAGARPGGATAVRPLLF
jgi:hypothetical protein